jgi:hypothetical protein
MKVLPKDNELLGKNQTIFSDIQRKLWKVIEALHFSLRINLDPIKDA